VKEGILIYLEYLVIVIGSSLTI